MFHSRFCIGGCVDFGCDFTGTILCHMSTLEISPLADAISRLQNDRSSGKNDRHVKHPLDLSVIITADILLCYSFLLFHRDGFLYSITCLEYTILQIHCDIFVYDVILINLITLQ